MQKISELIRFKCGIYCICNLVNGKQYIGSSVNIYNRLHEHLHNLQNNKAHNKHLQNSWNKYGKNSFDFSILEYCDEKDRFDREQFYINTLKPEYNLSLQVIANFGHSPSEESRQKISSTLKKKYKSGEIQTYKQDHTWIPCTLYTKYGEFIQSFKNIKEVCDFLSYHTTRSATFLNTIIYDKYCVVIDSEFKKSNIDIFNYILKNYYQCISSNGNYLISEDLNGNIKYHKTILDCAKYTKVSRSMIMKNSQATKENPYLPNKVNFKIYFSNEYIPIQDGAVYFKELNRISSGNIGENPKMDNTEINLDNKESKSSYSVESEPEKNIISPRVSDIPTEISG